VHMFAVCVLVLAACSGGSAPTKDLAATEDQKRPAPDRQGVIDAAAPDVSPWVACGNVSVERVCASPAGGSCCLGPASTVCPPGHTCEETSCGADPLAPDAAPCAPGSFCRSKQGCACLPSTGGPCPCGGSCLTSCAKTKKCSW